MNTFTYIKTQEYLFGDSLSVARAQLLMREDLGFLEHSQFAELAAMNSAWLV